MGFRDLEFFNVKKMGFRDLVFFLTLLKNIGFRDLVCFNVKNTWDLGI